MVQLRNQPVLVGRVEQPRRVQPVDELAPPVETAHGWQRIPGTRSCPTSHRHLPSNLRLRNLRYVNWDRGTEEEDDADERSGVTDGVGGGGAGGQAAPARLAARR